MGSQVPRELPGEGHPEGPGLEHPRSRQDAPVLGVDLVGVQGVVPEVQHLSHSAGFAPPEQHEGQEDVQDRSRAFLVADAGGEHGLPRGLGLGARWVGPQAVVGTGSPSLGGDQEVSEVMEGQGREVQGVRGQGYPAVRVDHAFGEGLQVEEGGDPRGDVGSSHGLPTGVLGSEGVCHDPCAESPSHHSGRGGGIIPTMLYLVSS